MVQHNEKCKILGIETSCDETAAAIVENGSRILSSVIATSLKEHTKYGGIIPEIASRRQLEYINPVVQKALEESACSLKDIKAVAVTSAPGLIGSLLVGTSFARALSSALSIPCVEVNHIQAHLYAAFLKKKNAEDVHLAPTLPALGLVVSGGHTSLYHLKDFNHFKLLGQTLDDAAGEAFDKVARLLGLGYPGGPVIDRLAKEAKPDGLRFTSAKLPNTYNFSFSGVKTAVLYHKQKNEHKDGFSVENVAYAFQNSVVSVLVEKTIDACVKKGVSTLVIGGGVAANSSLRETLTKEGARNKIEVFFPSIDLCMDNAAMIAGLAYHQY